MHAFIFEVVFQIQHWLLQPVLACYDVPGPCQAAPWWTEFWSRCALVPAGIPPLGFLPSGEGSSETGAHRTPHSGLRHIIINVSHTHTVTSHYGCTLFWSQTRVQSLPLFMKSVLPVKTLSATVMCPGLKRGSFSPFSLHSLVSSSDGFRQSLQAL